MSNYITPYPLPAVAADAVTSSLSVVTRTASMRKTVFASNRCLRSKPFTKSRVALPIAPTMLTGIGSYRPPLGVNVTVFVFQCDVARVQRGSPLSVVIAGWVGGRTQSPGRSSISSSNKSQLPIVEKAVETAALMLGSDKSRGYCLEMICADFLAGANAQEGES